MKEVKGNKVISFEKKKTDSKKKLNEEQKREKKLVIMGKKPYLKKNEVCLLSPNFKLASK